MFWHGLCDDGSLLSVVGCGKTLSYKPETDGANCSLYSILLRIYLENTTLRASITLTMQATLSKFINIEIICEG